MFFRSHGIQSDLCLLCENEKIKSKYSQASLMRGNGPIKPNQNDYAGRSAAHGVGSYNDSYETPSGTNAEKRTAQPRAVSQAPP